MSVRKPFLKVRRRRAAPARRSAGARLSRIGSDNAIIALNLNTRSKFEHLCTTVLQLIAVKLPGDLSNNVPMFRT